MLFTDAYASCPVCSPTRASLVTGQWPQRSGITDYIGAPTTPEQWKRQLLFPGPATGSFNGLQAKSKFQAIVEIRQSGSGFFYIYRNGFPPDLDRQNATDLRDSRRRWSWF